MFNLGKILRYWNRVIRFFIVIFLVILIINIIPKIVDFFQTRPETAIIVKRLLFTVINLLPPIVAMIFVVFIGARFAQAVYKLDNVRQGLNFLTRHIFDRPGFSPFMVFSGGEMTLGADDVLPKTGGPGGLVIHNDTAIVLERKGKLTRVEGCGLPFPSLQPFEIVYDIVDLRPKRRVYSVDAMTKEGIPITWDVEIQYQIDNGGQTPSPDVPFPFEKEAVFKAATGKWRRERTRLQDMDWGGWIVISQTEGMLRSIIARLSLDELIGLIKEDNPLLPPLNELGLSEEAALLATEGIVAREYIRQQLKDSLHKAAPKMGVKILEVKLHNPKVKDEITRQRIDSWETWWQAWFTKKSVNSEIDHIKRVEQSRIDGQIKPLKDLIDELNKLDTRWTVLIARLASVFAHNRPDVASRVFYPGQSLGMIKDIRQLFEEAGNWQGGNGDSRGGGNGSTAPPKPLPPPDSNDTDGIEWRSRIIRRLPVIDSIAAGTEKSISDEDTIGYIDILIKLPVTDEVEAGEPKPVSDENYDEYLQQTDKLEFEFEGQLLTMALLKGSKLSLSKDFEYFAVRVSGDSMNEANISPNDYVILRQTNVPRNRDIVAVVFRDEDDKATLKRIFIGRDGVTLKPESLNPKHQPRSLPSRAFAGDNPQVQVVGIAIAVLKQVN